MRTKNLTPFPFGARVTSTRPPEPEMVLIVRGRFRLVPDGVATPVEKTLPLAASDLAGIQGSLDVLAQGPLRAEAFDDDPKRGGTPTYPGDFADAKLQGEALLVGTAYAPEGKPVERCDVAMRIGDWEKRLAVFGARGWEEALIGQKATPPVSFVQLKLGYERAFGGEGSPHNPTGVGLDGHLLPFVEYPGDLVRSPSDRPNPAGFGPLSSEWPFRKRKLGTNYGPAYAARSPFYADDFDWRFFQAAPRDQWIDGYFRGDETIVLENLHRKHARLETRLPGLRIRAFVSDVAKDFREVPMVLDTVFLSPDDDEVLLTWRGRTPVLDRELEDVTTVLIGSEPLDAPARPLAAWHEDFARFEADPLGIDALPPAIVPHARAVLSGKALEPTELLDALVPGERERANDALRKSGEERTLEDFAVAALADAAEHPPVVARPGFVHAHLGLDEELARTRAGLEQASPEVLAHFDERLDASTLRTIDPTFRLPHERASSTDAVGPGANLDGRDLSGLDLSGVNLEGASLRGAQLKGTRLVGARLRGADFTEALLFKSDLTRADLRDATLVRVNASKAILTEANLTGARLEAAFFEDGLFANARFDECSAYETSLARADLTGASFRRARLRRAEFGGARLERTAFCGATVERTLFYEAQLVAVGFDGAILDGSSFDRSTLLDCSFLGAEGRNVNFAEATVTDGEFRYARLPGAQFTKSRVERASFDGATLVGARFFKAQLTATSFKSANLSHADLCRARLADVPFDGALLYDAKFLDTKGTGTSFEATLSRGTVRHS
ncbi:MAG: DUF2169 domain-containing protein [Deltaproteobacteria bacterium]|nr:DUF2169 domain-containing protein [Deltaproteobacteria bacterium]